MAPEVYEKKPYRAESVDMFALGRCLFEMTLGYPPFKSAHSRKNDQKFKLLKDGDYKQFWEGV
jgi:serine/threonine protein kinase